MENKISTGYPEFTSWLDGGYEKDVITMIAGPPGCGKTNLCFLACCSQAKKGNKIIFVDTEGGFSVDRIKQIVGEDCEKVLEDIFLLEPTNFEEQKKCFLKLLERVKKEHVSLIIVDGMAMLYRLELGDAVKSDSESKSQVSSAKDAERKNSENVKKVNREIAGQMRMLAEIARKQKIPVIITNQVYGGFLSEENWRKGVEREVSIVGGDLFKYWSKCIIELKKSGNRRRAVLLKHRSLPEKEFSFEIVKEGIKKKGWI